MASSKLDSFEGQVCSDDVVLGNRGDRYEFGSFESQTSPSFSNKSLPPEVTNPRRVPYQSSVEQRVHEDIRLRIIHFLFDNNIIGLNKLVHLFDRNLSENEWRVITDNPSDYWTIVAAKELKDAESQRNIGNFIFRRGVMDCGKRQKHYNLNQFVWYGRAVELFAIKNKRAAGIDDILEGITKEIAPEYMAVYAIKLGINERINYINKDGMKRIESYRKVIGKH